MHCTSCDHGLSHCHEALLEHADGTTECLDPACQLPHAVHEYRAAA